LENRRIKLHFKKELYNHKDNNYDILYIINGFYKYLFYEYFNIFDDILTICNGIKINSSILILKSTIMNNFRNSSTQNYEILNKYNIIILMKALFFFGDISKDFSEKEIKDYVKFFDGNIKITKEVKKLIKDLNDIKSLINHLSKIINYIPFFNIFINGKFARILMTDYKENHNKKYSSINYFNKKIKIFNIFLDDYLINKKYKKILETIISNNATINILNNDHKFEIFNDKVNEIYKKLSEKKIKTIYNNIDNNKIFLDNKSMQTLFTKFIKTNKELGKQSSTIFERYTDKNIEKI